MVQGDVSGYTNQVGPNQVMMQQSMSAAYAEQARLVRVSFRVNYATEYGEIIAIVGENA